MMKNNGPRLKTTEFHRMAQFHKIRKFMGIVYKILVILVVVGLWHLASSDLVPGPKETIIALFESVKSGALWVNILDSLRRYILGLFVGVVLGVGVGGLFGSCPKIAAAFEPLISILRPISPIAWVPFALIFWGIGDGASVFIISYAVFFPVLLLAIKEVRAVPADLVAAAKGFGASRWQVWAWVVVPASILGILSGLKLAASLAWINLVISEMLGAQTGLGYMIIDARNLLRLDLVLAAVLVIGLIGWVINGLFSWVEGATNRRFGR